MSNIFITSDTHFGHNNIIKFCKEPFTSIEQRDQVLIQNWNKKVGVNDLIYHLGDVTWYNKNKYKQIHQRLNGVKVLIIGNHDRSEIIDVFQDNAEHYLQINALNKKFCLFHFPIRQWNGMFSGSYMLHGHCHGFLGDTVRTCDVGVNNWNFTPASIEQVLERVNNSSVGYTREYKEIQK